MGLIWTVGQTGLPDTNAHLCEFFARYLPDISENCRASDWIVSAAEYLFFAAIIIFVLDLAWIIAKWFDSEKSSVSKKVTDSQKEQVKQEQALAVAISAAPSTPGPTTTEAPIAKPEVKTSEKQPDQEKVRRAEILSKLRNKYPQRIIADVTPEYLTGLYKDKFAIEGDRAIVPYIENWLLLFGEINDMSGRTAMFGTEVTFEREFTGPFIHMYFDDLWIKRLSVLTPKQNILALCQLNTAGSATAIFNHCELIDQDSGLPFSVP